MHHLEGLSMAQKIGIGMLGAGNVGGGVINALPTLRDRYLDLTANELQLIKVLVRDINKERIGLDSSQLTSEIDEVISDERVQIVIEVLGNEQPACNYIKRCLEAGKYVVTANKEVMAKHGAELLEIAHENSVAIFFEASVGGGIPIIGPLMRDFGANKITSVTAIINGTTNFILTKMSEETISFDKALFEAQELGYAEPDPSSDIEGVDAAYKLAILCSLAFGFDVDPYLIDRQGIVTIAEQDFRYAHDLGYTIKLLSTARLIDDKFSVSVKPTLIDLNKPLAKVDGVLNAIQIEGDLIDQVMFVGPGAGPQPTASAVLADVLELVRNHLDRDAYPIDHSPLKPIAVQSKSDLQSCYYLRLIVKDQLGVLAEIAKTLGDHGVSIASMIQSGEFSVGDAVELVLTTHLAYESEILSAIEYVKKINAVQEVGNIFPIDGVEEI